MAIPTSLSSEPLVLPSVLSADFSRLGEATAVVMEARMGGLPVMMIGIESQPVPRSGFPPTTPSTAAASTPLRPLELGTVTPITFLMMLPLQRRAIRSGNNPSTLRALAAA